MIFYPEFFPGPFTEKKLASGFIHALSGEISRRKPTCGRLFGLYTDNNAFTYASILATWKAGCGFIPLNHKFPAERLQRIISETGITCVLANARSKDAVKQLGITEIVTNDDPQWITGGDNTVEEVVIENELSDIAYILFTSGSTGVPKGIPITFRNVWAFTEDIHERLQLTPQDKVLQTYELSFDLSIGSSLMAWASGAKLYISPMDGIIPVDAVKMMLEHEVNVINMAPSTVNILKKYRILDEVQLPFITRTIFGGEAVPFQYTQDWQKAAPNTTMINAYGPTEATIWATYYTVSADTEKETRNGLIPIGRPAKKVLCHMHRDESISTRENQGELWLGGEHIFNGYINNPEKNAQVLTELEGEKYYRTGDLVEMLDSGNLIYLNRLDNQVKVNGYRVEPGEVEYKIRTTLGISACAVIPVTKNNETWLLAVLEKDVLTKEEKEKLQAAITFYMMPRKFITVKELPLNHNGKIDRLQLKNTYAGE
jgi:D-alanine--poly(phosphoribitol) ligase subunit 1